MTMTMWTSLRCSPQVSSCQMMKLHLHFLRSPKRGPARRKAWPGRTTGRGNPTKPLCTPPRLSSGPPAGRTSDRRHDREHHDTQILRRYLSSSMRTRQTCFLLSSPPKGIRRRQPAVKDPADCASPVMKKPPVYFKKIFHGCPLKVNSATSWENSATKDQHLILAAEEGIYTLNLNGSEATMELLYPGKCTWVYTINNVLMSVSGKSSQLHSHSLKELYEQARKDQRMVALPTHRLLPRKCAVTCKIPDTKGCKTCSVAGNAHRGCVFLCCGLEASVVLLQWYEPMHKFMLIKHFDFPLPNPVRVFEMVVVPQQEYPLVCIGVSRGTSPNLPVAVEYINLNSNTSWFTNSGLEKPCPDVVQVNQLDSSSLLVLIEKSVHIVGLDGELKSKWPHDNTFSHDVESIVYFEDTLLAVWRHGWQRRRQDFNEVLEELTDHRKIYRLVQSDRMVVLETRQTEDQSGMSNLYVLEIAENYVMLP
uniref:CNH domain-containing protein n=1 Tax=Sparus aurata TaxID=8175 RepID=A0A671WG35_SPAAU